MTRLCNFVCDTCSSPGCCKPRLSIMSAFLPPLEQANTDFALGSDSVFRFCLQILSPALKTCVAVNPPGSPGKHMPTTARKMHAISCVSCVSFPYCMNRMPRVGTGTRCPRAACICARRSQSCPICAWAQQCHARLDHGHSTAPRRFRVESAVQKRTAVHS